METKRRNMDVEESIERIFALIDEGDFQNAREEMVRLKKVLHGNLRIWCGPKP